jgi:GAF domain-containing protein
MMAQVLGERGIGARVLPPIAVSQGALGQLDLNGVRVVSLSYLHPQPQVYARYICRRLRRRAPHLKLVVCCWNPTPAKGATEDLAKQMGADAVFASLESCVNQVDAWISRQISPARTPPVPPDTEQDRIAALRDLGLGSARDRRFEEVTRAVAQAFGVPIALVSLVDEVRNPRHEATEAPSDPHTATQPAHESLDAGEVLVVEDVREDERFADDPLVLEKGIRFYAGAPLRTSSGVVVGTLCVIDTKPRDFSEADWLRLQAMTDELMADIITMAASAKPALPG